MFVPILMQNIITAHVKKELIMPPIKTNIKVKKLKELS